MKGVSDATALAILNTSGLSDEQKKVIVQGTSHEKILDDIGKATTATALSTDAYSATLAGLKLQAKTAATQLKALWGAFAANPALWIPAAIAGVAALTVAIGSYQKKRREAIAEAAEEAKSAIDDIESEFSEMQSVTDKAEKNFAELAKGVDLVSGENLSLTNEQYSEFLDISNQLAELYPTLPRVYDENGNAIVNLGNNAQDVSAKLQELLATQREIANYKIIDELPDVFEDALLTSKELDKQLKLLKADQESFSSTINAADSLGEISYLEDLIKSGGDLIVSDRDFDKQRQRLGELQDILNRYGIAYTTIETTKADSLGTYNESLIKLSPMSEENIENYKNDLRLASEEIISAYGYTLGDVSNELISIQNQREMTWAPFTSRLFAFLEEDAQYKEMSNQMQSTVQSILNNIDWGNIDDVDSYEAAENYIRKNIYSLVKKIPQIAEATDLNSQLMAGTLSYVDYKPAMDELMAEFETVLSEEDFATVTDVLSNELAQSLENAVETGVDKFSNESDKGVVREAILSFIKDSSINTESEVKQFQSMLNSGDYSSIEDVFKAYQDTYKTSIAAGGVDDIRTSLEEYTSTMEALDTAQKELSETGILTETTASTLQGTFGDLNNILIMTSKGWELNTEAIEAYKNGEDDLIQSDITEHMETLNGLYDENAEKLEQVNNEIATCTDKEGEHYQSLLSTRAALINERDSLDGSIRSLQNLQAQLNNAKSTYHDFINSFNEAQPGDEYDSVVSKLEEIKDLSDNGKWGNSSVREFVDLFTSLDMSSATTDDIANSFDRAYERATKFFTEGKEGAQNFVKELQNLGYATENVEGGFDFNIKDINALADDLNLSVDAVLLLFENLGSYGAEVNIGDFASQITDAGSLVDAYTLLLQKKEQLVSSGTYNASELEALEEEIEKYRERIDLIKQTQEQINALNSMEVNTPEYTELDSQIQQSLDELGMSREEVMDVVINVDTTQLEEQISRAATDKDVSVGMAEDSPLDGDISGVTEDKKRLVPIGVDPITLNIASNTLDELVEGKKRYMPVEPVLKNGGLLPIPTTSPAKKSTPKKAEVQGTGRGTTGYSGKALVGELGKELLVRDGRVIPVGEAGAEVVNVRPNDIIFNAEQTKSIEKSGVSSLSKGFVGGTGNKNDVAVSFSTFDLWDDFNNRVVETTKKTTKAAKQVADSAKDVSDETESLYDYFERMIDVLESEFNYLDAAMENLNGAVAKNPLVDRQMEIVRQEIEGYTSAVEMYRAKANEVLATLSPDIQQKIISGTIEIADYTGEANEKILDSIEEYTKWDGKVRDCTESIEKQTQVLADLSKVKFDNIIDDYEQINSIYTAGNDLVSSQIGLIEEMGGIVGEGYYQAQISNTQNMLRNLQAQRTAAVKAMEEAINAGTISKGSDEWAEMIDVINDIDSSIIQAKTDIESFNNAVLETKWQRFEQLQDILSSVGSDLEGMQDLLSDFTDIKVSNGKGTWTDEALTQLGLLGQQYEVNQFQAQQYAKAIENLEEQYEAGEWSTTEYLEKLAELKNGQWEAIDAYEAVEDAIMQLNETRIEEECDAIQEEIDAFKELTDAQIDSLQAAEDLHDYQRSISEQTKDIAKLEKQIAAMQNDDSATTVARRKQLEEQLAEAREELAETERDHSVEEQQNALNKQYEDYEKNRQDEMEALRKSLEDREAILSATFEIIKNNSDTIGQEIDKIAQEHGLEISSSITDAWNRGADAIASYGGVLNSHTSEFISELHDIEEATFELQDRADETSFYIRNIFTQNASVLVGQIYAARDAFGELQSVAQTTANTVAATMDASGNRIIYDPSTRRNSYSVGAYAKGGIVTKDTKNPLNSIARAVGEDSLIAAKAGESVLTPLQTEAMLKMAPIIESISKAVSRPGTALKNVPLKSGAINMTIDKVVNIEGNVSDDNAKMIADVAKTEINKVFAKINRDRKYNGY